MCWPFSKKPLVKVSGQADYVPGCDPTPEWMAGQIPSYSIPDLIKHLEFRMDIHQTYYDRILTGTFPANSGYGDANFHLWAIEGYQNAIYHLNKLEVV